MFIGFNYFLQFSLFGLNAPRGNTHHKEAQVPFLPLFSFLPFLPLLLPLPLVFGLSAPDGKTHHKKA
jgi:hypothetical protein